MTTDYERHLEELSQTVWLFESAYILLMNERERLLNDADGMVNRYDRLDSEISKLYDPDNLTRECEDKICQIERLRKEMDKCVVDIEKSRGLSEEASDIIDRYEALCGRRMIESNPNEISTLIQSQRMFANKTTAFLNRWQFEVRR